ncbi:MAG: hypothetical protein JOZ42_05880 [Acetobacteraceae bacterium]|nr:hypothetical protein [Acetobacteraceae bacterium]
MDGPYCAVLSALRSVVLDPGTFSWQAKTMDVRAGSQLTIALSPAPAVLFVDRFMPNGSVAHLRREAIPGLNSPRANAPQTIDVTVAARGELIVATGLSQAVTLPARPGGSEDSAAYLADLRGTIERAQHSGVIISGRIVFVAGGSS